MSFVGVSAGYCVAVGCRRCVFFYCIAVGCWCCCDYVSASCCFFRRLLELLSIDGVGIG